MLAGKALVVLSE